MAYFAGTAAREPVPNIRSPHPRTLPTRRHRTRKRILPVFPQLSRLLISRRELELLAAVLLSDLLDCSGRFFDCGRCALKLEEEGVFDGVGLGDETGVVYGCHH